MNRLFFQLQPKNIFFRDEKKIRKYFRPKIFSRFFFENFQPAKIFKQNFEFLEFSPKNIFGWKYFQIFFFISKKNIFWLELQKKSVHSFDVENWELSIYEVFRAILALRCDVRANMWHQNFKNRINFAPVPLADFMYFEDFISKKWKSCKKHDYVFWITCSSLRINRW